MRLLAATSLGVVLALTACGSDDNEATPGPGTGDAGTDSGDAGGGDGGGDAGDGGTPIECTDLVTPPAEGFFTDISKESGIKTNGFITNPTKAVPINDHSRLGFADINGDGFDDIVAHSLFPNPQNAGIPFTHLIQLNNGDGTFTDFSAESGLGDVQAAFFAFGDVDNDGDQDCFAGLDVPLFGESDRLFLNDGTGKFTEKTNSGVESTAGSSANALFADFNNDGNLDLFVGHGSTFAAAPDGLFFGKGDGTFSDETSKLSGNSARPTNGSVTCDFDNDGDLDIVVSTYGVSVANGHNVLWENDGKGKFTDVAKAKGFHAQAEGSYYLTATQQPEPGKTVDDYVGSNGFGVDCKDVNNDGNYDIYLTTIAHPNGGSPRIWADPSQLLINQGADGDHAFVNEFIDRELPFNEGDVDGALQDFDNDGLLDISVSRDNKYESGYPEDKLDQRAWFGLYRQKPDGKFESRGTQSGINQLNPVDSTTYQDCAMGEACPSGETCIRDKCRLECTSDDDCTADEICGARWDGTAVERTCSRQVKMRGAQNHAWADFDRDGDVDLLVGGRDKGSGRPNFLFRNDIGSKNSWIALHMVGDGDKVNRDAIGARVIFTYADGVVVSREVQSSRGMYNSMDSKTLYFGLGEYGCDFEISLRWPNGETVTLASGSLQPNRYSTITYPDVVEAK